MNNNKNICNTSRGSQRIIYTSQSGCGKKSVFQRFCPCFMASQCLPDNISSNWEWPGWEESFMMVLALMRQLEP